MSRPIVADSVTQLGADARQSVAIAGSHCGVYAAYCAARAGVRAVILNDAGIGRERAGVSGLAYLDGLEIPAAAISHRSARIGNGTDTERRGVISTVNEKAAALGLRPGITAIEAVRLLLERAPPWNGQAPEQREARTPIFSWDANGPAAAALDSATLMDPQDKGQIVITGSHGGLIGDRPESAAKVDVFAAVFNDADIGIDDAGLTRLPALDQRGIAAATVSAWSARIGDGRSIYEDGTISHLNGTARCYGGEIGISTREFIARLRHAGKEKS